MKNLIDYFDFLTEYVSDEHIKSKIRIGNIRKKISKNDLYISYDLSSGIGFEIIERIKDKYDLAEKYEVKSYGDLKQIKKDLSKDQKKYNLYISVHLPILEKRVIEEKSISEKRFSEIAVSWLYGIELSEGRFHNSSIENLKYQSLNITKDDIKICNQVKKLNENRVSGFKIQAFKKIIQELVYKKRTPESLELSKKDSRDLNIYYDGDSRIKHKHNEEWVIERWRYYKTKHINATDYKVFEKIEDEYLKEFGETISRSTIRSYLGKK